jgi:hypothetical protein
VVLGLVELVRKGSGALRDWLFAWTATYLVLNLASGGLPGPNLFRYNKDLEIVAPLFCVALAVAGSWLSRKARALAIAFGTAYIVFAVTKGLRAFAATFVLER